MTSQRDISEIPIVFFGTPEFAVGSLDKLLKAGCNIRAVVTMPDKQAGRGHKLITSDIKNYAEKHSLRVLQPNNLKNPDFLSELKNLNAELFIVIAFRMLPETVWKMPPLGTFNLHASLLPRYRGAAPINWAIINGDTTTGVTTFFLKHEIDTGDIIGQAQITIDSDENAGSVHDRLMELGAEMTLDTVNKIASGNLKTYPQPEGEYLPAPKIFKETCRIDWNKRSTDIHNLVRGLSPYPTAWTEMQLSQDSLATTVKIFETSIVSENNSISVRTPGTVICDKGHLRVVTADGEIEILSLQPAGKKRMEAGAFLLGYHPERFI